MADRRRKKEDEPEDVEPNEDENGDDEGDLEDQVAEETGSDLSLRIMADRVEIDLPRDGNEKAALDALGKLLDALNK